MYETCFDKNINRKYKCHMTYPPWPITGVILTYC